VLSVLDRAPRGKCISLEVW